MTAAEFRDKLYDEQPLDKPWPTYYYVDSDTYANVCQALFDHQATNENENSVKEMTLSFGLNNGIMFKGMELILEVTPKTYLESKELKILYDLLSHQYISYENPDAINLIRKIRTIIGED